MKYAELAAGLLIGTALGGVIAANSATPGGASASKDEVREIVRQVISQEPQLILDSVQKYQEDQHNSELGKANAMVKDPAVQEAIYGAGHAPFVGPADSKKVVVEFFDYNCPACKMQFEELAKFIKKDKDVKVIFMEYPIFGPQSEANSRIGIAVYRLGGDKYFDFHTLMMKHEGRTDEKTALKYAQQVGLDPEKVKAESKTKEVADMLASKRELGNKLQLSGTPTLIVGDELVPHALGLADLENKLNPPQ